ncbi:MAG: signal transduction histidine kinase/CheY-like chemotaxis protein [Arenicella sp.]|jgi:signal transduction histidine kinase/CheY-like chemotaxis protein
MDKSIALEPAESKSVWLTQVAQQIHDYRKIAYLCVDQDWTVIDVSENFKNFGFIGVALGVDATDVVDFLVGADIKTELELPLLASPSNTPIGVMLLPSQDGLTVVIGDASREFSRRRLLSQKAKENRMLLIAQARLMQKLQTAQKQLHQRNDDLREAADLQSSFMSGVSHEFRTPLASIIGYSDQLQTGLEKLPRRIVSRNVDAIQRCSKHLLTLVENLLDHGELETSDIELNPRPTNIGQLFEDAITMLNHTAASKGVALGLQLDMDSDLLVLVDASRLRQCLVNLMGNALKFTDQGRVIVRVAHIDDELRISVRDTGIGISPEHLEKVRLPFWQAPNDGKAGTGLGLTITAKIIEMIGGSFSIQSTLGEGTIVDFIVSAPMLLPEFVEEISTHELAPEPLHFLLAEDDNDIATLTCLLLEERGVTVTRVANGADAVLLLGTTTFDLVLLDLHMPVMDGYSSVSAIRGKGDFTPIVVMTASTVKADRDRAHKLGCDGFLVKPVDVGDLLALANQLLT